MHTAASALFIWKILLLHLVLRNAKRIYRLTQAFQIGFYRHTYRVCYHSPTDSHCFQQLPSQGKYHCYFPHSTPSTHDKKKKRANETKFLHKLVSQKIKQITRRVQWNMENRFAIHNFIGYRRFMSVYKYNRSTFSTICFNTAARLVPIRVQNTNEAKKNYYFFCLMLLVLAQCYPYRHHQH